MADYDAVDKLKNRLDLLRPIDTERLSAVREKFRLDWTYHSNALEGNPLSLSETSFFVREGLTSKGKPLAAYLEVKNHVTALDFLEQVVQEKSAPTDSLMKKYHAMLFSSIDYMEVRSGPEIQRLRIEAGAYKKQNNHVVRLDGQIREFTDWIHVPDEVEKLFADLRERQATTHPIQTAARFHHSLVSIHPFMDGNGRVARLLMNTILMQAGFTPAIIPVEEKRRYLEALQAADEGNHELLFQLVEECVARSLRTTVDVIEGREAFNFDDLARMVRNFAEQSRAIESELGPATIQPELRAGQTASHVITSVTQLLNAHVTASQSSEIPLSLNSQGTNPYSFPHLQQLRQGKSNTIVALLGIQSTKRFVPTMQVAFTCLFNRTEVVLVGWPLIAQYNQQFQEVPESNPQVANLIGSIYQDDWSQSDVEAFVLRVLREGYRRWHAEMDRRKSMIAAEELELTKQRPRRD